MVNEDGDFRWVRLLRVYWNVVMRRGIVEGSWFLEVEFFYLLVL